MEILGKTGATKAKKEVLKTVNAGANIKNIVNNTKLQQPKKIDFTKIIASQKEKGPK